MEKENLDNLFRESFDEFSQAPDPKVWKRIEASLDQKARSRRRVIPLWWPVGGAAAALALLLFLLIPGSDEISLPQTAPISTTPSTSSEIEQLNQTVDTETQVSEADVATQPSIENDLVEQNNGVTQEERDFNTPVVAVTKQNESNKESPAGDLTNNTVEQRSSALQVQGADEVIAQNKESDPVSQDEGLTTEPAVAADASSARTESDEIRTEAVAEAEIKEKKALEELLSAPEEVKLKKPGNPEGKWAIGPSIAPVYFNGLGDGSPIDQAFVSNDKSGSFNMSYGLQVSYQVSKRLQVRSGVHKVDFGYNTDDIIFSSSLQASSATQMRNVDYSPSAEYLVVGNQISEPSKADTRTRTEVAARNTSRTGTMVQEFGYLEVPFEINYALVDRTLGVHLISGISSLFLVDNAVSLESDSGTTEVGQANNLNDVNFSANFGLGVQYQVSDKIKLQVEPLLKYQLNTFSDTAGEFRPYSIGIYSGIRYKF